MGVVLIWLVGDEAAGGGGGGAVVNGNPNGVSHG